VKERSVLYERGVAIALLVAQTYLCKLKTDRGQRSLFLKQIFMPHVPVDVKTNKEIILCQLENLWI